MIAQDKASQENITPELALRVLKQGNERFVQQKALTRDHLAQVKQTTSGQFPFAVVLGCIDSRVPTELIFDQGFGDIFNVRIAGNCVNHDVLGSLEFSCKVAGAKLVVVLGHTQCGAVKGACDGVELGNLTALLNKIQPAINETKEPSDPSQRNAANAQFVEAVAENNVHHSLQEILTKSPILKEMRDAGDIALVGAIYDVGTGKVAFDE